jgi:hypothetical protein
LRLRGGWAPPEELELGIAAGGYIDQAIAEDRGSHEWDKTQTKWFNVQILNSSRFQEITGLAPPETPASADLYAELGYPFFDLWEEKTTVAGDFSGVKSVGQLEGISEPSVIPKNVVKLGSHHKEDPTVRKETFRRKSFSFARKLFQRKSSQTSPAPITASPSVGVELKEVDKALRGGVISQGIYSDEVRFFYLGDGTLPLFRSNQELREALR